MGEAINPGLDQASAEALIRTMMPKPSTSTPAAEATAGGAGTNQNKFAQEGHAHPRLTSTTYVTLAADNTATVTFTRTFASKPGVVMTEVDASGTQPLVCVVQSFVMSSGVYTGCVIKGYRSQPLPAQASLNPLAILSAVTSGLNNLIASLTGFNVFGGTASGASVSCIAIARSDIV